MAARQSTQRRVLLISGGDLFGESLENMLHSLEDVTLLGPVAVGENIFAHIDQERPDIVLVVEGKHDLDRVSSLTSQIIERHPSLPVIRSTLSHSAVRVYTSREFPARTSELVQAIRGLPISRE